MRILNDLVLLEKQVYILNFKGASNANSTYMYIADKDSKCSRDASVCDKFNTHEKIKIMKANILIFVIFLFLSNMPIFGQTKTDSVNNNSVKYKYALGIGAGYTTGSGFSFKFTPNKFGIQATILPYSNENLSRFSIGLTLLYTLIETEKINFYLYQGNSYIYKKIYNRYTHSSYINNYFNNGVGFGIEFVFSKRIGINIMFGYAFYENFERFSLTGETGLYLKF